MTGLKCPGDAASARRTTAPRTLLITSLGLLFGCLLCGIPSVSAQAPALWQVSDNNTGRSQGDPDPGEYDTSDSDVAEFDLEPSSGTASTAFTDDEILKSLHEVLAKSEFRHLKRREQQRESRNLSEETPEWVREFFDWLFGPDNEYTESSGLNVTWAADLLQILVYGLLAGAVVVLIVVIFRHTRTTQIDDGFTFDEGEEAIQPTVPPGETAVNEYERRALAFARDGNFRMALRELVLGSLSWTERSGLIRYRRGLTNRDYVRAVWRDSERRVAMLVIINAFERVFYGHRAALPEHFDECLTAFQASFQEAADASAPR